MFTIGEFSRISGLTIKTLRFYHESGLLIPAHADPETGYRYYNDAQIDQARAIVFLRELEFPLAEIAEILRHMGEDEPVLELIERRKAGLEERIRALRKSVKLLNTFLDEERQVKTMMAERGFDVEEKTVPSLLIAGVRMKGYYRDCGKGFGRIGQSLGRFISGKPFMLHYDSEYRDGDADFEACMPVKGRKAAPDGISLRELPGGPCVALVHKGPYEQLGQSYAKITKYIKNKGYRIVMPTREVYLKGPGMLWKGNPKHYVTEIQMLVENGPAAAPRT
jgi:DNA-binding transcriptional MerR regulator/effector-binding domain-containing protein